VRAALLSLALAAGACFGAPLSAAAQDAPKAEPWYRAITVHAFAEASFVYSFNRPDSGLNALRVFDYDDRELKLDVAELVVQRPASKPLELGFRVDATVGQSVPEVAASYGLFRDRDTGEAEDYDLHQVFVSWVAPLGKGLKIDAGKFVTPFGLEVIDGYDGYNDNQTRSLLFGYAIPFTHTGLRASYPFSEKVAGTVAVVQGWDNWSDNNGAKSILVQVVFTPSPRWALTLNAMGGPEQKDNRRDDRYLYNAVVTFKPTDRLTLGFDAVAGQEEGLQGPGARACWTAVAGYLRWVVSGRVALAARAEVFDDADGVRTGAAQRVKEITLTPECKLGHHFVVRGDLRHDWSDAEPFEKGDTPSSRQTTATVALLFVY